MKLRMLKKICKREKTENSWEIFRIIWAKKARVIIKAKKVAHRKSREETYASFDNLWKAVRYIQHWALKQLCLSDIQKSDKGYAIESREKIEELKKILLLASHLANLSNILYF